MQANLSLLARFLAKTGRHAGVQGANRPVSCSDAISDTISPEEPLEGRLLSVVAFFPL